jgi:tRNA splicing endonuclease
MGSDTMLKPTKNKKGGFEESDPVLAEKLHEEGFGFDDGSLSALEAGCLLAANKAKLHKGNLATLLSSEKKKDKNFPFALAAYSRIRSTGRMVRPFSDGGKYLRVYSPGLGREEERPSQLLCLLPGKPPSPQTLEKEVEKAHLARLDLIIACGTEKEIKFYKISAFNF